MAITKPGKKVNLFILGVQKAGTTALAEFLEEHSDVCLVAGKEAHVFDDPDYYRSDEKQAFAEHKFSTKLQHYNEEKYICDATPITLFHPRFVSQCVAYNPDAKFVVLLRDPVARAYSHYQMSKRRGLELRSPLVAFLCERWRIKGWQQHLPTAPFEHAYRDFSYLSRGRYQRQLNVLYDLVPPEQVLVLRQEELLAHHNDVLAQLFDFLEIETSKVTQKVVFKGEYKDRIPWAARWYARLYFALCKGK